MSYFIATCQGIEKQISYQPKITSLQNLKDELNQIFGFTFDDYSLNYIDIDGDLTNIEDHLDFDCFISMGKEDMLILNVVSDKKPVIKNINQVNFFKKDQELKSEQMSDFKEDEIYQQNPENEQFKTLEIREQFNENYHQIVENQTHESSIKTLSDCLSESEVLNQLKEKVNAIKLQTEKMFAEMKTELVKNKRKNSGIFPREIESGIIHKMICCNNCGLNPINGKRFKCVVCKSYDICEVCEENNFHSHHPMVRISESSKSTAYYNQLTDLIKIALGDLRSSDPALKKRILKGIFGDYVNEQSIEIIVQTRGKKSAEDIINEFHGLLQ